MDFLKKIVQIFIYVTAGNTICGALYVTVVRPEYDIDQSFLWQAIIVAAICALGTFIFLSRHELSKKQNFIRTLVHYLYINIVVIGGACLFQWINLEDSFGLFIMFVFVAIIYACVTMFLFKVDQQTARDLNRRLMKIHREDNSEDNFS
ncbi:MAG: hypothetical protein K0S47_1006 [Herbinix sp.]|jgi:drug/metabolite transporter (DMT)-like permease|nr:hypothetical protein [Herbinix sp.]